MAKSYKIVAHEEDCQMVQGNFTEYKIEAAEGYPVSVRQGNSRQCTCDPKVFDFDLEAVLDVHSEL